jgi:hypothetical protein
MSINKFLVFFAIILLSMSFVSATCIDFNDPTTFQGKIGEWAPERYVIEDDVTLCPGTYDLPKGIVVYGMDKTLDCNGAVLQGNDSNTGIYLGRGAGINVPFQPHNVIKNCVINNYNTGISVNLAYYVTIKDNTISSCNTGISFMGGRYATIDNNIIDNGGSYYGIKLDKAVQGYDSNGAEVKNNLIDGFVQRGITIKETDNTTIYNNIIKNIGDKVLYFSMSNNNLIYNNYLEVGQGVYFYESRINNWNIALTPGTNIIGGPSIGGNYWSDYTGFDNNADGFGDTPYTNTNVYDLLPLTNEVSVVEPPVEEEPKTEKCEHLITILKLEKGKKIPKVLPYSNEVFNIYTLDEEVIGYIQAENNKISNYDCVEHEKPTYKVYLEDTGVIDNILDAESPIDELNSRKKSKELTIKGVGIIKKTKGSFISLGLKIAGLFT